MVKCLPLVTPTWNMVIEVWIHTQPSIFFRRLPSQDICRTFLYVPSTKENQSFKTKLRWQIYLPSLYYIICDLKRKMFKLVWSKNYNISGWNTNSEVKIMYNKHKKTKSTSSLTHLESSLFLEQKNSPYLGELLCNLSHQLEAPHSG